MREHGNALRKRERRQEIALDPLTHTHHMHRLRRAFHPPVPAQVVVGAVPIVLSIRLVVLGLVAHQVLEREAVMTGHEIDAGEPTAPAGLEEIAAAGKARREMAYLPGISAPEVPAGVPILAVPFGPSDRKAADLVPVRPEVPRLRDQLG